MSLNDLRNKFKKEIQTAADELCNSLPLSKPQLRKAFSDAELKEMHKMIREVNQAKNKTTKSAALAKHAGTALKLLKKLGVGI